IETAGIAKEQEEQRLTAATQSLPATEDNSVPQPVVAPPPSTPTPSDTTFVSPPVSTVAQQLQTIRATPASAPLPPPPAPAPQLPAEPPVQHTYQPPVTGARPNTPLTSIEQDPTQYTVRTGQVAVPPRSQNQP
ncbi:MAG TPA: hypothetical protein VFO38_00015, partial [Candidatus Saccharimonadales bacterium]|nr:hypothetical protein [Candidatus Saccharimonadales bacterium]